MPDAYTLTTWRSFPMTTLPSAVDRPYLAALEWDDLRHLDDAARERFMWSDDPFGCRLRDDIWYERERRFEARDYRATPDPRQG